MRWPPPCCPGHVPAPQTAGMLGRPRSSGARRPWRCRPDTDLQAYYIATHCARIVDLLRHEKNKRLVQIEKVQAGCNLQEVIWAEGTDPASLRDNPLISTTVKVCRVQQEKGKCGRVPFPLLPIPGIPELKINHFLGYENWPSIGDIGRGSYRRMMSFLKAI